MTNSTKPLGRILITNDDGFRAEGLRVLEQVAMELSDDVWVVAPEQDQSGTSHSISLYHPLRVYSEDDRHHSVAGTPSDCVMLAVQHILRDRRPDLILSGINRGANIADSVPYSGTVGGAMTGLLMGIPSIALSQVFTDRTQLRWDTSARLAPSLIRELMERGWPEDVCLNINFPDLPVEEVQGVRITRQGRGSIRGVQVEERWDNRGLAYYWLGFSRAPDKVVGEDTDVAAIRGGYVSVNPLRFEKPLEGPWDVMAEQLTECIRSA